MTKGTKELQTSSNRRRDDDKSAEAIGENAPRSHGGKQGVSASIAVGLILPGVRAQCEVSV